MISAEFPSFPCVPPSLLKLGICRSSDPTDPKVRIAAGKSPFASRISIKGQ